MAKPRVFVSSTYYDLKYIRRNLELFIEQMGYEPVLFESGDIPFHDNLPLDTSCYREIENCHMLILIIGGRYGSPATGEPERPREELDRAFAAYNSITKLEYEKAIEKRIPVFVFVEKGVHAEYETYGHNKRNDTIAYAHVDSVNVFRLLDEIASRRTGNYVQPFDNFDDIAAWLREQWAGLFADHLRAASTGAQFTTLALQIQELKGVTGALKEYVEAIMRKIRPENYERIIADEQRRMDEERASRLKREDMIRALAHLAGVTDTELDILRKLRVAQNAKEFIDLLAGPAEKKDEFWKTYAEPVELDFAELKKTYAPPATGPN
jgi:hypothetical protein